MAKETHTIQDIEGLMYEYADKIKNAETKKEKQELIKKLKSIEKHFNNCNEKHINGKKYPTRIPSYYDPTPQTKKQKEELLKLIDSVETPELRDHPIEHCECNVNHSGIFVTDPKTYGSD